MSHEEQAMQVMTKVDLSAICSCPKDVVQQFCSGGTERCVSSVVNFGDVFHDCSRFECIVESRSRRRFF